MIEICVSHSQLCVFDSTLAEPFNDWSERHFSQGFAWRPASVAFRTLVAEAPHEIHLYVNEPIMEMGSDVVRAFRVPLEITQGHLEVASISDSRSFELPWGTYALQIEFLKIGEGETQQVNLRLNEGRSGFLILKADEDILVDEDFDLAAQPAS